MELNNGFLIYLIVLPFVYVKHLRPIPWKRRVWFILFGVYFCLVLEATMFPIPLTLSSIQNNFMRRGDRSILDSIDLIPNLSLRAITSRGFYLNIAMFIPFGFLVNKIFIYRSRLWNTFKYGLIFTIAIETIQLVGIVGLGMSRSFDVNDIIANTIGAMIGYLIYHVVSMFLRKEPMI